MRNLKKIEVGLVDGGKNTDRHNGGDNNVYAAICATSNGPILLLIDNMVDSVITGVYKQCCTPHPEAIFTVCADKGCTSGPCSAK